MSVKNETDESHVKVFWPHYLLLYSSAKVRKVFWRKAYLRAE